MKSLLFTLVLSSMSLAYAESSVTCSFQPIETGAFAPMNLKIGATKVTQLAGVSVQNKNWVITASDLLMTGETLITASPVALKQSENATSSVDSKSSIVLVMKGSGYTKVKDQAGDEFELMCFTNPNK
jgi:hypothetical protein